MQYDPESTDEEPKPVAVRPTNWEKTSPVKPDLAASATFDTGLDKPGVELSSHRIETVKPKASSRRRNAPNRYCSGAVISTFSPPEIGEKKQETDKKQVKEEPMTEKAKVRSTKN